MRRRQLLAAGAVGASLGTAGCVAGYQGSQEAATGDGDDEVTTLPLAEQGVPSTICEEDIKPDGILAVDEPAFADDWPDDVAETYGRLTDDTTVVAVTAEEGTRAYPLRVLEVHEAVNDDFGGPLLVTFCPICNSGMVAERRVDGETTTFHVSGLLWRAPDIYGAASAKDDRVFSGSGDDEDIRNSGNLVLYDAVTGSYWSQILAQAICGPREGDRLTVRPSTLTTWGEWHADHPDTEVLVPPPVSGVVDPPVEE
jgi:hypothetical protein